MKEVAAWEFTLPDRVKQFPSEARRVTLGSSSASSTLISDRATLQAALSHGGARRLSWQSHHMVVRER
jgi:hypothetical protein